MARIRNFSSKATQTRARVQKYRRLKKLYKIYENESVRQEYSESTEHIYEPSENSHNQNTFCLKEKLRLWAIKPRITKRAINDLLTILIIAGCNFLPKDSRTLMSTPRVVEINTLSSGKLWYYGVQKCLRDALKKVDRDLMIRLDFNFDGMQIFNSASLCFWPILTSIQEFPKKRPMVVGIWCGYSKPPLTEYLTQLVFELKEIFLHGFLIDGHHISVKFGRCVSDSPARSLIKGVVNFNHAFGCQRCITPGEYNIAKHRMSFPIIDGARRTNEMFRARTQKQHHRNEKSIMEELDIDMVFDFPTSDPLHLIDLGVMKKCIKRWICGEKGYSRKWNKTKIKVVSDLLIQINAQMPSDIHRSLRTLDKLSFWKGTEFRSFLLYVGVVALKDALPLDEYEHYLTLCCAVTICSCKKYKKFIPLAKIMFDTYINSYIAIYGRDTITSNVHNLTHITEDMLEQGIGNLMEISTYKYENCLRMMGLQLRNCNLPLEQISRRILEALKIEQNNIDDIDEHTFVPKVKYAQVDCTTHKAYQRIEVKPGIFLSNRKFGDQWFLSRSGDVIKMKYAIEQDNIFLICGVRIKRKEPFFTSPLLSTKLYIYLSDGQFCDGVCYEKIENILTKLMCINYKEKFVYIPILHTMEEFN